ncbi:MAG TPA: transcription antitermination factor NusB [Casimicrobiaceae bacterium]
MSAQSPNPRRRRARELVLQGLYERQVGHGDADAIAASLEAGPEFADTDREYFHALWRGVTRDYDELLGTLAPDVDRRVDELAPIERALLVIGTWELAHRREIPYRVVISEGIELAKRYGGTDGHKFVNAVLDRVAAKLRADEIRALRGG